LQAEEGALLVARGVGVLDAEDLAALDLAEGGVVCAEVEGAGLRLASGVGVDGQGSHPG
jgi:hypothetical protein